MYHKRGVQTTQALHALTKDIIKYCLDQGVEIILLGKLTPIRKNKDNGGKVNQKLHAWSFQKFAQLLTYKAEAVGIQIKTVSERNTSKTCSSCGRNGTRAKRGLLSVRINKARNMARNKMQI
ncbi:MAG: IS200/IS605 family accessory protein TnpB-related protein [Candidatus Hermodarchaeota archaeon]